MGERARVRNQARAEIESEERQREGTADGLSVLRIINMSQRNTLMSQIDASNEDTDGL